MIDPHAGYAAAVRAVLPDAAIAVDHFHLIMLGNKAVTAVRQRVTRDLLDRRGRTTDPVWANRRLLLRGRERLSEPALARMWNGCVDHDPSGQILSAWIGKEELRALCATAAQGGHPGEIRDRLYAFYRWCADAQIPELTTLAETIETWWPAIEVFLTTGLTNARTEGTNRLIKQVKRAACGFRNRENYRRRVRLHCTRQTRRLYYRGVVSKKTFSVLDDYLWTLTYKWATYSHPNKSKWWVSARYFGKFNKFRNNRWVFGDAASGAHLARFAWTDIVRHIMVKGGASPDDPALTEYWAERRRKIKPPVDGYTLRLLTRQDGRCPLCGNELLTADQPPESPREWERWWLLVTRKAIAADYLVHHGRPDPADGDQTRLVHASCRSELRVRQRRNTAPRPEPPLRLA